MRIKLSALRDLAEIRESGDRDEVMAALRRLRDGPSSNAERLPFRRLDAFRMQAGRHRVLYRRRAGEVEVVGVTGGRGEDRPGHDLREALQAYFRTRAPEGLLAAHLFGSRAPASPRSAHRESDVDVAVLFEPSVCPAGPDATELRVRLGADLVAVTGCDEVDVVVLNHASPELRRRVADTGLPVFVADRRALHAFERNARLRAADVAPFVDGGRRRMLERLR